MTKKECHGCIWCRKKRKKDRLYQCNYSGWVPLKMITECGIWEHWTKRKVRQRREMQI